MDRGSTSQIRKVEELTAVATISSTGSDPIGRYVGSLGVSFPFATEYGSQIDVLGVLGGPDIDGGPELRAGGLGYRLGLGTGTTLYVNYDYGDYLLGTERLMPLDVTGERETMALGLRHVWTLGEDKLTGSFEFAAKSHADEMMGLEVADEDLRLLRLALTYDSGKPFAFRRRLALAVTKGLSGFGASEADNPLPSARGVTPEFLRVAFSAEVSIPVQPATYVNAGVIGQFTRDSLPVSQRCGYGTNAYARGFDRSYVMGDQCLGGRVELARDFQPPDMSTGALRRTQGFVAVDGGRLRNMGSAVFSGDRDEWSSANWGVRTLQGNFLGEIALSHILSKPEGSTPQDQTRLWFQAAYQF
ncbi:ShlB/FhaC/HecB family hemolysin secretion/activation protein [Alloyangia pacifica]|uniref:ShlB/FhaC/HecB family hemolysin secretion/activation protein n=1 Tax=Alloyangia pacifica TaxID=311180 RepID=UPI001CFC79F8|nr:ShlB/FhaC/HecB family hemolysin secretion/activation protein [Alloyangia pacifica]